MSPGAGALPQWKRELLQRRAARARPAPPAPPPPPPPPPPEPPAPPHSDNADEELRYGPGIVKRLKSRYLSLALRDAPRRRPSVLRRAASLEHLLDPCPPPAPCPHPAPAPRPARPLSLAAPPAPHPASPHRRDLVKRARSVDALSRLEARYDPPSPPPPPRAPPAPRAPRPPRRPAPLLRDAERPPPDLVRSTLRKFEPAATRRPVPAARVAAALRTLDLTSTPEPRARSPSPLAAPANLSAIEEAEWASPPAAASPRLVSRAALDGIARAGCTTRYAFEAPRRGSHLPPLAAANPVLVGRARRVGVIRPMPAPALQRALPAPLPPEQELAYKPIDDSRDVDVISQVTEEDLSNTPPASEPAATVEVGSPPRRWMPPSALVEPTPRPPLSPPPPTSSRDTTPEPPPEKPDMAAKPKIISKPEILTKPETRTKPELSPKPEEEPKKVAMKKAELICEKKNAELTCEPAVVLRPVVDTTACQPLTNGAGIAAAAGSPVAERAWGGGARRGLSRAPAPATSVVFNFSGRKEVPDYIENDGLVLRAARRHRIKAGEPGVVVLRPELVSAADSDSESEPDGRPPSPPAPCTVRFVNDNVLINGRSSMPARPDRARHARLKLQFDDSLTRTFEYPSETSLCEDPSPAPGDPGAGGQLAEPAHLAPLADNTHIVSAALARYTPHKTSAHHFQLGVTRRDVTADTDAAATDHNDNEREVVEEEECGDARPCGADAARSWSEARTLATDLLF